MYSNSKSNQSFPDPLAPVEKKVDNRYGLKYAKAIEAYIHDHVGINRDDGSIGKMYFNKTLEDWIGFKINNRTKFDLTISSGLALLAAQKTKPKKISNFAESKFFRRYKVIG